MMPYDMNKRGGEILTAKPHPRPIMLTTETCFKSPEFITFCEEVERECEKVFSNNYASPSYCFDDGWQLELILELYNNGCPIPDAVNEMCEGIESEAIDAYLSTPPWDR